MKCPKCNYEWETKSKMVFVSCPSCLLKVKNDMKSDNNDSKLKGENKDNVA